MFHMAMTCERGDAPNAWRLRVGWPARGRTIRMSIWTPPWPGWSNSRLRLVARQELPDEQLSPHHTVMTICNYHHHHHHILSCWHSHSNTSQLKLVLPRSRPLVSTDLYKAPLLYITSLVQYIYYHIVSHHKLGNLGNHHISKLRLIYSMYWSWK